jgi:hypothetical protein
VRFPIRFDSWYRWLSTVLGLPPSTAYVDVAAGEIEVRMGWAFRARFHVSDVSSAAAVDMRPLSRGVHGFGGRWLVNGAGGPIVRIDLKDGQRARVMGIPVGLRELLVSVNDAAGLVRALRG